MILFFYGPLGLVLSVWLNELNSCLLTGERFVLLARKNKFRVYTSAAIFVFALGTRRPVSWLVDWLVGWVVDAG